MSDWNSDFDRNNQPPYDPVARDTNATWGWVAAAVFIVVILAVAFGIGHQPGQQTASNYVNPPPVAHTAPPPVSLAPIAPTPNPPAQPSTQQQ
jgi:hypothetical protein